ncbi:MAG: hypothetical protein V1755_12295, partial [Chloroflexota bacterium]
MQALEIDQDLPGGLITELAVLFEQLPYDPVQVERAIGIESHGGDRGFVEYGVKNHRGGDTGECLLTG